jgi:hypothetical protein
MEALFIAYFKKLLFRNCQNAISFKILPIDGGHTCRPNSLDRRQLGLVRGEGHIVDLENIFKKKIAIFGKIKKKCLLWSCNTKLQVVKT